MHNQRLAYVIDWEGAGLRFLEHRDVIIDGAIFRCVGLRRYLLRPHRKGYLVGLLIADLPPAANQSLKQCGDE
jgi:hypothetical protein